MYANVNAVENQEGVNPRRINYWRLWLFDTVLVSAGVLFFLATQYGTYEFFGKACAMALLPFIPVIVLVGGAGSTIFALTKVLDRETLVEAADSAGFAGWPRAGDHFVAGAVGRIQVARSPAGLHLSGERSGFGQPGADRGLFNLFAQRVAGRVPG